MRNQFAYYNSMSCSEVNRVLLEKCKFYNTNFNEFAKLQEENIREVNET